MKLRMFRHAASGHVSSTHPSPRWLIGIGRERDAFMEGLATLVGSGMPMLTAIRTAGEETRTKRMRAVATSLEQSIDDGMSFSDALEQTGVFSSQTLSLVRIGERSGKLVQNLRVIAAQQEKTRQFQSRIRSAVLYPVFVLSLTLVIGVAIAWFILPKLSDVFDQLGLQVPLLTRVLIGVGKFLGSYGYIAVPTAGIVMVTAGYLLFVHPRTRRFGQELVFYIPGVHRLMKEVELSRFTYLIGTLLDAGLTITQAIASVEASTTLRRYKQFYGWLGERLDEGESFQKSFAGYPRLNKVLPRSVQQLIVVGEQSGRLAETFLKINTTYEMRTEATTKDLTVILEPIMLFIVWLGVVGVALAVVLPIYSLIGQFKY